MSEELKTQEKSIRDILYVLFRHKWKIIPFFIAAAVISLAIAITMPDMYLSSAKILLMGRRTSPIELMTRLPFDEELYSEVELLKSRGFAESVVDRVGLEKILYVPVKESKLSSTYLKLLKKMSIENKEDKNLDSIILKEKAIKIIGNTLQVIIVPRSTILNITYVARTPELAQSILTTIVDAYFDKHIEVHTVTDSLQFLTEETEKLKLEQQKSEEALRNFRNQMDIFSLPEQRASYLQRIGQLEISIEQTRADIRSSMATISELKGNIEMRNRLREEEIRLIGLKARFQTLIEQLDKTKAELSVLNESEQRYNELLRNVQTLEDNYRRYVASLEQAHIAQTLEKQKISNVSIMQKPTFYPEPVSQQRKKIFGIGILLGLVGGVGFAFIIEFMDHTIRFTDELESRFSFKNVTAVPYIDVTMIARLINKRAKELKKVPLFKLKEKSRNVIAWLYALKEVRESFELMKNYVYEGIKNTKKDSPDAPFVLAVTSYNRKEGVSSIATGLAYILSHREKENVLLVDANLHQPDEERITGVDRPEGLFEIKLKKEINKISDSNVIDFYTGKGMDEYLSQAERFREINKLLPKMEKYSTKLVILDLPSISEGVSALHSASLANGTILVIQSEKLRREVLNHTKSQLEKSGAVVTAVVLNKRKFYIPKWVYRRM